MTLPITFPDWVPWWLQLLVTVAVVLIGLAFIFMPFSVFGVKTRLEQVEGRLEDLAADIRTLASRLPEPGRGIVDDDLPGTLRAEPETFVPSRPPIPPASWQAEQRARPAARGGGASRTEPRL